MSTESDERYYTLTVAHQDLSVIMRALKEMADRREAANENATVVLEIRDNLIQQRDAQ